MYLDPSEPVLLGGPARVDGQLTLGFVVFSLFAPGGRISRRPGWQRPHLKSNETMPGADV